MSEHARFSPSKMERIIECPGSLALEEKCPDTVSKYAAEGTAAHTLAQWALTDGRFYAHAYQGRIIEVIEKKGTVHEQRFEFETDEEMCDYVQIYIDKILEKIETYKTLGAEVTLFVEERVDISRVIGVENQFGTADVILLVVFTDGTALLDVNDLKYGKGVAVIAEDNQQLKTYGLGAYDLYSITHNITRVNLAIHMPRLEYVSEWDISVEDLLAFGDVLKDAAETALGNVTLLNMKKDAKLLDLNPGEKHCRFCKAKGICPALATQVVGKISKAASVDDFDDVSEVKSHVKEIIAESTDRVERGLVDNEMLAEFMDAADLVEDWITAVRARVEALLFENGNEPGVVPGYMLSEGRKGNRAWQSAETVEEIMKSMRIKREEMYNLKLISPTQAEKIFKNSTRRWNKIKDFIFQPEGKPSVVRDNDPKRKRLVVKPAIDDFENLEDEFADLV